jgi:ribonuclease J
VRERETLGQDGILVLNLAVDEKTGQMSGEPEIISRGFILLDELDPMMTDLKNELKKTVRSSDGNLENQVLRSVKSFLYKETKRNPFIFVNIQRN